MHLLCSLHGRHGRLSGQLVRNRKKPTSATGSCGRTRSLHLTSAEHTVTIHSNEHILQWKLEMWSQCYFCAVKQHWPMACFLLIPWVEDWPWLNSFLLRELHASSWRSKSAGKLYGQSVSHFFPWISMASMVYTPNFNGQGARSSSPDEGIHHLEARPLIRIENRMRSARICAGSNG